jgi:hypothetical protein
MRGALATLEGRFAEAKALIVEGFPTAQEARDPNAFGTFAVSIGIQRLLTGRIAEMVSATMAIVDVYPLSKEFVDVILSFCLAELGIETDARAYLARVGRADDISLPRNGFWLIGMALLSRASYRLHDRATAEKVYRQLVPYANWNASVFTVGLGSLSGSLALVAEAAGHLDDAETHFEAALVANARNGWLPWVADTQVHYAAFLLQRSQPEDEQRAARLLDAAENTAAELGMEVLTREAAGLRRRTPGGDGADPGRGLAMTRRQRARARLSATGRAVVARWTRDDSDEDLVRRFGGNLAQRTLFSAMARSFQPAMAYGFTGDLTFELRPPEDELDAAAADWWTIEVRGRSASGRRGRSDNAAVTVHADLADFVRLVAGELHPVRALIEGTIEVEGDIMVAARLPDLFGAVEALDGLTAHR